MTEAVGAIVGTRLRPVYELIEDESQAADSEGSAEMAEEDLIDLIKDNFDASEVRSGRGARERGRLMPKGPDMNQLMKQAQQMQAEMAKAQEELSSETVEASAGGGMVKVTMTGDMQLREIKI